MDPAPKSRRGGRRPGAGRKRKSPTEIAGVDLAAALEAPVPEEVDSVAAGHAVASIEALGRQLLYGHSEPAKIDAAKELLDRGYGKPTVEAGGDPFLPFLGRAPVRLIANDVREAARKYANLAIAVLVKIRDNGTTEAARVRAARTLTDRGLGTVTPAKVPATLGDLKPKMGKKEERAADAKAAAVGRYATPPPPGTIQ